MIEKMLKGLIRRSQLRTLVTADCDAAVTHRKLAGCVVERYECTECTDARKGEELPSRIVEYPIVKRATWEERERCAKSRLAFVRLIEDWS